MLWIPPSEFLSWLSCWEGSRKSTSRVLRLCFSMLQKPSKRCKESCWSWRKEKHPGGSGLAGGEKVDSHNKVIKNLLQAQSLREVKMERCLTGGPLLGSYFFLNVDRGAIFHTAEGQALVFRIIYDHG